MNFHTDQMFVLFWTAVQPHSTNTSNNCHLLSSCHTIHWVEYSHILYQFIMYCYSIITGIRDIVSSINVCHCCLLPFPRSLFHRTGLSLIVFVQGFLTKSVFICAVWVEIAAFDWSNTSTVRTTVKNYWRGLGG